MSATQHNVTVKLGTKVLPLVQGESKNGNPVWVLCLGKSVKAAVSFGVTGIKAPTANMPEKVEFNFAGQSVVVVLSRGATKPNPETGKGGGKPMMSGASRVAVAALEDKVKEFTCKISQQADGTWNMSIKVIGVGGNSGGSVDLDDFSLTPAQAKALAAL